MKTGIRIGVSKKAVKEVSKAINAILSSGAEEKTIRAALTALQGTCQVNHTSLHNCNVSNCHDSGVQIDDVGESNG